MNLKYTRLLATHLLLVLLLTGALGSCSRKPKEATEGARGRVAQVSMEYLRLCFLNNMEHINSYVLLSEYLKNRGMSLAEYTSQVNKLPRRWQIDEHPVLQLILLDVDVRGDKGTVYFQRGGSESDFPRIRIEVEWSGNSWVIINDNIFGQDGLFEKG